MCCIGVPLLLPRLANAPSRPHTVMAHRVVVIDDDSDRSHSLTTHLNDRLRCSIEPARDLEAAVKAVSSAPDVVFATVDAAGTTPVEVASRIRNAWPQASVIVAGAPSSTQHAVQTVRAGAYEYLTAQETTASRCAQSIEEAVSDRRRSRTGQSGAITRAGGTDKLVGTSEAMQDVYDRIGAAAQIDMSVLVRGESGTGKELVARTIHAQSARRDGPLLLVDCTTVSPHTLEQALLSDEPGGDFDAAMGYDHPDNRTVVLDHVEELSVDAQAMLNRVLQAQSVRRAGRAGPDARARAGARVIGLTRCDLRTRVRDKRFRKDLYFRLAKFPIEVPPLRVREDDVLHLARHFLDRHVDECESVEEAVIDDEAQETLKAYCWPGNVRELRTVIERAAYVASRSGPAIEIEVDHLMLEPGDPAHEPVGRGARDAAHEATDAASGDPSGPAPVNDGAHPSQVAVNGETPRGDGTSGMHASTNADATAPPNALDERTEAGGVALGTDDEPILSIDELKRRAVERAYRLCDGDVDRAAVELDIGRSTMYRMLKRYDIRDEG